jgi:hypothetical protein
MSTKVDSKPGSGIVEFQWFGATRIASWPSLPTRVALSQAMQKACGVVDWKKDDKGKNKPVIDRDAASDPELPLVWAALLGFLLSDVKASFPGCRRDVLRYGEAVLDELIRRHGFDAMSELAGIGSALHSAMELDSDAFWVEVAENKGK